MSRYSPDEMLDLWRLVRGFEPLRTDAVVSRTDGVDLDALLRLEIDSWYARLLESAPFEMLDLTDIADDVSVLRSDSDPDVGIIHLPPEVVRVALVQLEGWSNPATIVTDPASPLMELQLSPYTRGGTDAPVAIYRPGELMLYSLPGEPGEPRIARLQAVVRSTDGSYSFTDLALESITSHKSFLLP